MMKKFFFTALLALSLIFSFTPVFGAGNTKAKSSSNQAVAQVSKVNINSANIDSLTQLPGIGAKTAKKIIDYRKDNGQFKSPADLLNVKGIGQKKFDKLKSHISI